MNTGQIIDALLSDRWLANFAIPNYAPAGWWENDVFEITKASYWHEFEVKATRSDFFRDADKSQMMKGTAGRILRKKHDLLAGAYAGGPARFTFVVPEGLITPEELPPFAGLYYAVRDKWKRIGFRIIRKAPKIHALKVDPGTLRGAEAVCYYRWHRARLTPSEPTHEDGAGI